MTQGDPTGLLGLNGCHESRKNWGMLKSSGISGHSPWTERNSWITGTGVSTFVILACVCWVWGGVRWWSMSLHRDTLDEGGSVELRVPPNCSRFMTALFLLGYTLCNKFVTREQPP